MTDVIVEQTYNVEVVVDDYISMNLKVPKKMTVVEFKGLMLKVESIFKITKKESFFSGDNIQNENSRKNSAKWTEEMRKQLKENYSKGVDYLQQMDIFKGFRRGQLTGQYYMMKKKGEI